ncbi:pirin family protein [Paludisphaera rhizosphaerae]|uniref:pirin family protein n=1 Tax=Paludisphaera rhizosphaerae TaxID=2711216 RepID=UPI0013EDAC6B|nr:pirin family protein [Paludisphaera rhizosphaerae]
MITVRKAAERGGADHGWLQTAHTFSFSNYYDPAHMGFRSLRVINEDVVQPAHGFGEHGHRDMEIVTYVLSGELGHRDSMDHASVLRPGEFQRMTAGRGIRHSEMNASDEQPVHFYQIWLLPERPGLDPSYEQKAFPESERRDAWQVVASPDGRDGSLRIHQDASIHLATLDAGAELTRTLAPGRHAWLQVLKGSVELNGRALETSDGAAVSEESSLSIKAGAPAEVMLFDLA